jgi:bifunctional non-homologous end joining protein LigD
MSLSLYKKKRNFSDTPEPSGKEKSSAKALKFVVQKHDASHLHYDFRLEMQGVLKSWAVPKGPSMNPDNKRLAMMVEDHPYDYRDFEGIIPAGNYGGGTVIVWDEGTYEIYEGEEMTVKEQEKNLVKALYAGNLKIVLHGKKLKGMFHLFQLKKDENGKSWLLVKDNDKYAIDADITSKNKSVKSGKTIAQIAKENGTEPNHPELEGVKPKPSKKAVRIPAAIKTPKKSATKKPVAKAGKKKIAELSDIDPASIESAVKTSMPREIKPMLATLVDEAFDNEKWIYEIKWDGYRAVAFVKDGKAQLVSRNLKPFTEKYGPVTDALSSLPFNAIFDGEIVAIDDNGVPNFQLMQNWQNTPVHLQFYIFDLIWYNGYDVTALPLLERKSLLEKILPADDPVLRYSDHVVGEGKKFFELAMKKGLEGIMAKKADSKYYLGSRTDAWLKIKVNQRQEVVIAGFTEPRNARQYFGALMLGIYKDGELIYIGHSGSGFNTKTLAATYKKLQPLVTDKCPFKKCPKSNMPVTWVKPKLVCEIKFSEWTRDGLARHPIFMGLREDKTAEEVHMEKSKTINSMVKSTTGKSKDAATGKTKTASKKAATKSPAKSATKSASKASKKSASKTAGKKEGATSGVKKKPVTNDPVVPLKIADGKDQVISLNGHELKLTNLDKIYWPKEKATKLDLVNYYIKIAPWMLPYMKDRPQSLHRHPNGINGPSFFQKNTEGKILPWIPTHRDFSESTNAYVNYLICNDEATLVYMANMGCIEMHPWHSRVQSWDKPDWSLIDLDPDGTIKFEQVIECANVVKRVLDSLGAESCVKTSGSTGIHIYVPLGAKYDFEQSKQFAELVVTLVHHELPAYTSLERSPSKRRNKIYLDYLQNRQTQTAAAPYSLRPKPGVPVSTPLHWEEVKKGVTPTTYNMKNIFERLKTEGDIFGAVLGKGVDLAKILKKLESA